MQNFRKTANSGIIFQLFDPARENSLLRTMQCQISRVGCLSWRQHVLSA